MTLAHENGLFCLCKDKKDDINIKWELPETTLQKKEDKIQKEFDDKREEDRIKTETNTEQLKTALREEGEKIAYTINRAMNRDTGEDHLRDMIGETQQIMANRFDRLIVKKEDP